jgi:peptidoglycan LD-endopeptidase LytH
MVVHMSMKSIFIFLTIALINLSCSSTLHKIFGGNKTPHEEYVEKLEDKKLDNTPEGRAWLAASTKALENPQLIQLPYKQNGSFQGNRPRSLGLKFHATQGERLTFTLNKQKTYKFALYSDLFKANDISGSPVLSTDTSLSQFSFDVNESGDYILRLQPQLFQSGEYSLSVVIGPSLGFPVSYAKANVGSFWGDARDGGKRSHEGIDVFAPKNSPAIAAATGYITGVKQEGIGGKTVWLRPEGKNYTLYYAHLDKQLVHEGQFLQKGEIIGLVGNTGNAKYTASHLHFGIYTSHGAVDPWPFVNKTIKSAAEIPYKSLAVSLKLIKSKKAGDKLIASNTILTPLAVTSSAYIAETPDGGIISVSFKEVRQIKQTTKSFDTVEETKPLPSRKSKESYNG